MPVVGFGFSKITAEKKNPIKGKVGINNNVSIKSLEEAELRVGKDKQKGLRINFEFVSKYEPKIGEIKLTGDVLFLDDPKKIKDIAKDWKKNKKLPKEVTASVMNSILAKCHIQALMESQAVNLPSPIPLPRVKVGGEEKRYIG